MSEHLVYDMANKASTLQGNAVNLIGFEFDGTACFRKGTKDGPDAIREISDGIETYSPYLDRDTSKVTFYDLGNLNVGKGPDIEENWNQANRHLDELCTGRDLSSEKIKLLTLGGEHSISYAPISYYLKAYPELVLLHLDAHADLRDGYLGYHYSHASIIRRVLDHFGSEHQLIQYGIRSGTKEEYEWMQENKTLCTSLDAFIEKVNQIPDSTPIYLTLDLDYFDPSFFPGTGTPEPGGETFHSFIKLMKILIRKNFVGADAVELSPGIDSTGNSSVFASKVVRELILALSEERK